MDKKISISAMALLLFSSCAWSVALPRGSAYDSHMQNVTYNSQNSTIVNTRAGFVSTLIFDDDEEVIDAQPGFPAGWKINKDKNRVGITPVPIKQPVTAADGKNVEQVFTPTDKDWQTNLFVTTTKRYYSLMLHVIDDNKPVNGLAFVVRYSYPGEARQQAAAAQAARQKELQDIQEKELIQARFKKATAPRNFNYTKRIAKGSESISPDFAYDDGRFTYLGFSPQKLIPAPFVVVNGHEQVITPTFETQGNYRVMILRSLSPRFVLRMGNQVVGIENAGYGKVTIAAGSTVSPSVILEDK
ncbi:P-type conjugative transfer protein VirB9 [Salmonella enterica]|uniref:P-type conjugative transfer protein VirB9 n=1 Tax=Salmonella enterica TaxID=28901 RepID=A0A750MN99_SALER|nr:P-type conjugative transfer protein VirB9 [Salmonella enterica subsp. enterica serovar Nottingham]EAO9321731.1 P-type conjugative transfer protein VirB9 [Salmonella enterica]EIG0952003.1 P-type conjugative transfer protein VirB9 [Salmonella enterica subsp. enterica serovar Muenchen]EAT1859516.1 P-type conjugative transfer protein VirB9 [Salmonella enterica]EAV8252622.1 P-type conjugative transfer protein VirB9 [Salmonella enterica]